MSAGRSRTPVLAGISLVLLAAVAADRAGMFSGGGAAGRGVRAEYLARAKDAVEERALISRGEAWRASAERARTEWDRLAPGVVRAATPELAEARFREIVLASMEDIRLISPARINYIRDAAASAAGPVRTLRLSVQFDAATPRDACTIVDRLEHLAEARSRIEGLKVDGPGRIQLPEQVTVTLTLSTSAFVVEEAS
jgi:hypothetical protein